MKTKIACIIPAAGWGSVCAVRSTPKVLEEVGDKRMINRIIETVVAARCADSVTVVTGANEYGVQIRTVLDPDRHSHLRIVTQPRRQGAADAVKQALMYLSDEQHVLVTFGDMPLWRPSTIRQLVDEHLAHRDAAISMVTIALKPGHRTERYGRIVRDVDGNILAALEPSELQGVTLSGAATVNPSLYVFDREWLVRNLPLIPPTDKGDGFPPEYHLPKLLPIAHDQGVKIVEVSLDDPSEALGVNTPAELDEVREVLDKREEIEEIARFVKDYRRRHGIQVGDPVPELPRESEVGYYLFGMLTVTREHTSYWHDLYGDDGLRKVVLNRIATRPRAVA